MGKRRKKEKRNLSISEKEYTGKIIATSGSSTETSKIKSKKSTEKKLSIPKAAKVAMNSEIKLQVQ